VLKPGHAPGEPLRAELKARVAARWQPFAPSEVKFVRGLPKTRNAKVMRRVVRAFTWVAIRVMFLRWRIRRQLMKSGRLMTPVTGNLRPA